MDAWRFREESESEFVSVWREFIANAADISMRPLELRVSPNPVRPGESVTVTAVSRSAFLEAASRLPASMRLAVEVSNGATREPVRMYPTGSIGILSGTFRAPAQAVSLVVRANAGDTDERAADSIQLQVMKNVQRPSSLTPDLALALAAATRGAVIGSSRSSTIVDIIESKLRESAQPTTWHPMRSAWWIVPFAFLLGAEWWLRRRSGRP
jgi:hypothetical protein